MNPSPIIEVINLHKSFKDLVAVNSISFKIKTGQCFGLLGPNGAGKSTTLEIIEGITHPDHGTIFYKGEPKGRRFKLEAGIQFQTTALMEFLTVRDQLKMFALFYSSPLPLNKLIQLCNLHDFIDRDASKLSGGQRQRLLFALSLINNPDIVFLDEPTTGLDPQARSHFWQLINNVKAQGKTVVLTTHYMDEAQALCDYLIIMDHGNIISSGSPQELLDLHFDYALLSLKLDDWCDNFPLQEQTHIRDNRVYINSTNIPSTVQTLIESKVSLSSLQIKTPSLEDLFLKLTGHSLRDST